jgi:hypothetical protein
MKRSTNAIVSLVVAALVLTSALAPAQVPKAAAPAEAKKTKVKVEVKKADAEKAVPAERVVVRPVAANQPNLLPLIQQFSQQLRPGVVAEYHFVRTVCNPSEEQRKVLAGDAGGVYKDVVLKYADMQQKMMQGQWVWNTPQPEAAVLIEDGLAKAVKDHLPAEMAQKYQAEVDRRKADRRESAVLFFVSRLDQQLLLTDAQRDALSETLTKNWSDSWAQSLDFFLNNDQFVPNIPDKFVTPGLSSTQRQIWSGLQKNNGIVWGWTGLNAAGGPDDDRLEPELGEALKVAHAEMEKNAKPDEAGAAPKPAMEKVKANR